MGVMIDRLVRRLDVSTQWPLNDDRDIWDRIDLWIALRESNHQYLEDYVDWDQDGTGRRYMVDPLAPRIPEAFASLQYGALPEIVAADDADQDRLDGLVDDNQLGSELQRMVHIRSSEGQVWWRVYLDHLAADHPLLEWHSRQAVTAYWLGKKLRACGFITRLDPLEEATGVGHPNTSIAWRWLELHDDRHVENALYRGTDRTVGERVELTDHPETEHLRPDPWAHGMGEMIAGRIVNRFGVNFREGVSDLDGIEDLLLALNESVAIAHENTRLAGKKRVVAPASALDANGQLPAGSEVLVAETVADSAALGEEGKQQGAAAMFKVIEYSYDAQPMIAYQDNLAVKALTRIGITPQFIGMPIDGEGSALTGVGFRLRLIPSINAGNDRAQDTDSKLPGILELLQRLDAAPGEQDGNGMVGGFGRPWKAAEQAPSVDRGSALPEDQTEETDRHATAVGAEIESRQTAIERMNPEWDSDRVDVEMKRLAAEQKLFGSGGLASLIRDTAPPRAESSHQNGDQPAGDGTGLDQPATGAGAAVGAA